MVGQEMKVAAVSEIGLCKRENQDCILARIGEGPLGDFGLFVVADGMGGQSGGRQAAELAIHICEDWWQRVLPKLIETDEKNTCHNAIMSLVEAAHHLNEAIIGLGTQLGSEPGTTFSALFLYGKGYGYVHLGDSRIYKAGSQFEQITSDDTWVSQQIRSGVITTAQAENHPQKHILTQCAGSNDRVHVHHSFGSVEQGTGFILCSDGFYNHLCASELAILPASRSDMDNRISQAVETIYARGASDNLSAIIIST